MTAAGSDGAVPDQRETVVKVGAIIEWLDDISAFRGTATLTADSGVHINVHGNTTLKAKTDLKVQGGKTVPDRGITQPP